MFSERINHPSLANLLVTRMKVAVFRDIALCNLANIYPCFRGAVSQKTTVFMFLSMTTSNLTLLEESSLAIVV
jgi:hypothetical protein